MNTLARRRFCRIWLLAGLTSLTPFAVSAAETIKLAYALTTDFLPAFVAQDKGFFAAHGVDVAFSLVPNTVAITNAIVSGAVDIGTTNTVSVLQAADAGLPLVIVAAAQTLPTGSKLGVVAGKDSGIKGPKDLVGRKVAQIAIGTILNIMTNRWLEENGVDYKTVKYVEVPLPQMGDLLRSGQIDAAVMAAPFYEQVVAQGIGYPAGDLYANAPNGAVLTNYASTLPWVQSHAAALKGFRDALREGTDFVKSDPKGAREILAKWTKLPQATVDMIGLPGLAVTVQTVNIQWIADVLEHQGKLQNKPDVASVIAP